MQSTTRTIQKTSEGKCNKDIQKVDKTYGKVNQFGSQKQPKTRPC